MHYWRFGIGGGHMVLMLLFWVVVIGVLFYLFKNVINSADSKNEQAKSKNALEIAKQRYARGEINKEEYQEIVELLEED